MTLYESLYKGLNSFSNSGKELYRTENCKCTLLLVLPLKNAITCSLVAIMLIPMASFVLDVQLTNALHAIDCLNHKFSTKIVNTCFVSLLRLFHTVSFKNAFPHLKLHLNCIVQSVLLFPLVRFSQICFHPLYFVKTCFAVIQQSLLTRNTFRNQGIQTYNEPLTIYLTTIQ